MSPILRHRFTINMLHITNPVCKESKFKRIALTYFKNVDRCLPIARKNPDGPKNLWKFFEYLQGLSSFFAIQNGTT